MFRSCRARALAACAILCLLAKAARADEVTGFHAVLAIDTNSFKRGGDLKSGLLANKEHLTKVLMEVYNGLPEQYRRNNRFTLDTLEGNDVSPDGIRRFFKSRIGKLEPSCGIFFYYCGHGAWDRKHGHFLATGGGDIYRREILALMNNTGAKSIVLITDCCSSYADFTPPQRKVPAKWQVFRKLFMQNDGVVDIQAATEGEFGWVNLKEGGFFTRSLVKYLCEPPESFGTQQAQSVSWEAFFGQVKRQTMSVFTAAKNNANNGDEIKKSAMQTPFAFRLSGWDWQFTSRLVLQNNTNRTVCVWLRYYDRNFGTGVWGWYPAANVNPLYYEIKPGSRITPLFEGYPIEANAIQYWANTAPAGVIWGTRQSPRFLRLHPRGYQGQLQFLTIPFNGPK